MSEPTEKKEERIVSREEVAKTDEYYAEVMEGEKYNNHPIIKTENGVLRWKAKDSVNSLVD